MIHHNSNLLYDIYNTLNEHNRRQNLNLLLISNYLDTYFQVNQKVFL